MTSLWPGGACDPCERHRHQDCIGWRKTPGAYCGCAAGLCLIRLMTERWRDRRANQRKGETDGKPK